MRICWTNIVGSNVVPPSSSKVLWRLWSCRKSNFTDLQLSSNLTDFLNEFAVNLCPEISMKSCPRLCHACKCLPSEITSVWMQGKGLGMVAKLPSSIQEIHGHFWDWAATGETVDFPTEILHKAISNEALAVLAVLPVAVLWSLPSHLHLNLRKLGHMHQDTTCQGQVLPRYGSARITGWRTSFQESKRARRSVFFN